MRGYLLDTCIVCYWLDASRKEHQRVAAHIDSRPAGSPLAVSVTTLGEIEYGQSVGADDAVLVRAQFNSLLQDQLPMVLEIKKSTTPHYGDLRARLFKKYSPRRGRRARRPEELIDPTTGRDLGIQENDLWIASQAIEHNLVLVTHDRMTHIRAVVKDLLTIEDWATSG